MEWQRPLRWWLIWSKPEMRPKAFPRWPRWPLPDRRQAQRRIWCPPVLQLQSALAEAGTAVDVVTALGASVEADGYRTLRLEFMGRTDA
jgi:hypothetical protein